jgi:hypothetical protein
LLAAVFYLLWRGGGVNQAVVDKGGNIDIWLVCSHCFFLSLDNYFIIIQNKRDAENLRFFPAEI